MAPTKTTRSRLRSSTTESYSLEQCNEIINGQFRRTRNPSAPGGEGRSTPAGDAADPRRNASDTRRGASENASDNSSGAAGGESEEIPLEIPFEVGAEGRESNINRVALSVWDQLLPTNNMMRIIGENSFTRGLQRLLSVQQQEEIMKLTRTNMIDRRETFI